MQPHYEHSNLRPHGKSTLVSKTVIQIGEHLELPATRMVYSRNEELFGEGEPAEFIYKVISGAVRMTRFLVDGRRQVTGFRLPGDVFGLELDERHHYSAEAIGDSEIAVVKRSALDRTVAHNASAMRDLWALTCAHLEDVQNQMLLLGRKTATERVVAFLLEMARRSPANDVIELPMSRMDIADYLGLTIETVSRTLTQLQRVRAITLPTSRHIILENRNALTTLDA